MKGCSIESFKLLNGNLKGTLAYSAIPPLI